MKNYLILILLLIGFMNFGIAQIQETTTQNGVSPVVSVETISNSGAIEKEIIRNPAMDLIEKNGGLVYAEVRLDGNLTHIFKGKEKNADFDAAIELMQKKDFIQSISKINSEEYQVVFIHGVTDAQQRSFYDALGYSGYFFKAN